ncbi:F0F1 ATP synthase subunit epsilon [bacterium]|nr:F0F1 ATP synthase subunit epsilon [bacterium]
MPDKIKVDIITPDQKVYSEEATALRVPGYNGYFGVLPGHTPFVAAMKIGEIKLENDGQTHYFSASGGFVEVFPSNVSILAETAESAASLDVARAEASRDRARKRLQEGRKNWNLNRARVALSRAINRIAVAKRS